MPRSTHAIAVLVAVLVVVAGCRTITGRSAGQWIDDKTTTAKVKAAVASAQIGTMTRVDVDTSSGAVFLTGVTSNDSERQRIVEAARMAADGKPVASNLVLSTAKRDQAAAAGGMEPSASPRTQPPAVATAQPGQPHLASATTPPPTRLKFSRLEAEAPALGRFAAYDESGRRVATLHAAGIRVARFGHHDPPDGRPAHRSCLHLPPSRLGRPAVPRGAVARETTAGTGARVAETTRAAGA
ncbi:MAG: BON domain-containing protein, partial [Candidatus Rokuibacteriota bacterium]